MKGRDRIVLMGIIVLAVAAAGWMLVVSPERKKATSLNAQVESAKSELSTAEGQLSTARGAQSQYASAYSTVVSLGKAVPAAPEVPSLVYQLANATNERSVEFNSIVAGGSTGSPSSAAAATAAFTEMPFTFIFNGGFFDLEHLFRELTSFTNYSSSGGLTVDGRLLTIQSVKLAPGGGNEGSAAKKGALSGTITASAYVLPASQGLTDGATASAPAGAATATPTSPSSTSSSTTS